MLRHSGWPLNQGTTAPLVLVQIYAAHIRHLDLIPVWSSSDELGLGSPVLLFYHRAFFYIAGFISVFGLGLKASVVLTVAYVSRNRCLRNASFAQSGHGQQASVHGGLTGVSIYELCVHGLVGSSG